MVSSSLKTTDRESLENIKNFTPGDFKIVRDIYSLHPKEELSHQLFIKALRDEVRTKERHGDKEKQ